MKTRLLAAAALAAAALAAVAALTVPAFAADTSAQPQVAQYSSVACTPARDPAIPLAIWLTPQGVQPLAMPPNWGAAMRGSCVGTRQFAPASQPFLGPAPYPQSIWMFGVAPSQQYRGT